MTTRGNMSGRVGKGSDSPTNFKKKTSTETTKTPTKASELKRQTYYMSEDIIDAISVYCAVNKIDKSQFVRKACAKMLGKEYLEAELALKSKED